MGEKIYIGNFAKGLKQDRLPFVIDNDSFPVLVNAYSWRGRIKRKRGTQLLARLELQVALEDSGTIKSPWTTFSGTTDFPELAAGSLTVQVDSTITAISNANPADVTAVNNFNVGQTVFISGVVGMTELNGNSYTILSSTGADYTINVDSTAFTPYSSGGVGAVFADSIAITDYVGGSFTATFDIPFLADGTVFIDYSYYPVLPVMGLEDYIVTPNPYPYTIAFDTVNAYQLFQSSSEDNFYNVSYYKSTGFPVTWTGADYQQFWSTNYQGAFWATNGVPGLNWTGPITAISQPAMTSLTITSAGNDANVGDYVFLFEIVETIVIGQLMLNGVSGIVTSPGNPFTITVPPGTYNNYVSGGIIQYLTDSLGMGDGIRWYDGDPTAQTGLDPSGITGWVNFAPPLSLGPTDFVDYQSKQYYLAGATAILPFKDRLLFFGPWIQAADGTPATYLQDTVIWSWNGTPYYSEPAPLAPSGFAYGTDPSAFYVNITGKGGFLSAGIVQNIVTVIPNEDVLLIGFTGKKTRLEYTGDDFFPFQFYTINSELGSSATFSGVTLDRGGLDIGSYGLALTTQVSSQRIDLDIPDLIFSIANTSNGAQRVNSARDFFREWVYFTYPYDGSNWVYPTQTLHYNYRDNTWGIFFENYTVHGSFRRINSSLVWAQVGNTYPTWSVWDDPWDSSTSTIEEPSVIAGNQQGFVMLLDQGTGEGPSAYIDAISQVNPVTLQITSPNHCLLENDYIQLQNIIGSINLNGLIGQVSIILMLSGIPDPNNFNLTFLVPTTFTGRYMGGGVFARLAQPFIQSKQFPPFWNDGKQVRLGAQKYLLDATTAGQITLQIYTSQDPDDAWNNGPIVPSFGSTNNSLVYSNILYTCPEIPVITMTNFKLGFVGDGVTLDYNFLLSYPIVPGSVSFIIGNVATFVDNGTGNLLGTGTGDPTASTINYITGAVTLVFDTAPLSQFSFVSYQYSIQNIQSPTAASQYQIWHRLNTSLIGDTVQLGFTLSDAQMRNIVIATSEIALQAIEIDVTPSKDLC